MLLGLDAAVAQAAASTPRLSTPPTATGSRVSRGDRPGLADTLLLLAAREEHGAIRLDKLALAEALAQKLVDELYSAPAGDQGAVAREEMFARRPLVRFVVERLIPALDRPRPVGSS